MPQYSGMWTLSQVSQAVKNQTWTGLPPSVVEYLVVAGGGGGSSAGGGAGGLLAGFSGVTVGTQLFVTVGAGGAANVYPSTTNPGSNGVNSVLIATSLAATTGNIVALGGGGGANQNPTNNGLSGGSGGGSGNGGVGGSGTSGQGNAGGSSGFAPMAGGGGAGTVGLNSASSSLPGNGGAGIASAISGTVTTYAGGGGGGNNNTGSASSGGVGGGGAGGVQSVSNSVAGSVNTGGGGGGGYGVFVDGAAGGSGIVIIRYPGTTQFFTGGTLSYANGYMIHTFYANGTLVPIAGTLYANPDYQIARSLRFNSADSAYLTRTPASATNQKTWTWSGWVKRGALSSGQSLFSAQSTTTANLLYCYFSSGDKLVFYQYSASGSTTDGYKESTQLFRDTAAWYHIVVVVDTTQGIAADRIKFYVNGVQITSFSNEVNFTHNTNTYLNATNPQNIARNPDNSNYFNGYMADVNFIDGVALTPASFGWTNPATGVWAPLDFVGTYGTNGYNLTFSDNTNTTSATLGADTSGNGNNWTPNNFSVSAGADNDSLVDTPTPYGTDTGAGGEVRGNYAVLNPLAVGTSTSLTNGNLDSTISSSTGSSNPSTFVMTTGKWYWEVINTATTNQSTLLGIIRANLNPASISIFSNPNGVYYNSAGIKNIDGTQTAYGSAWGSSAVAYNIGIALDVDGGTVTFYLNGASQGAITLPSNTLGWAAHGLFGSASGSSVSNYNFGQRAFAYTAPSGFKALCTQNLPTPTIGATSATLASQFFAPAIYTGAGATQSVTVGFQPDFTWIKNRTLGANWHVLTDSVRGVQKEIYTNSTAVEATLTTTGVNQFNASGFQILGNSNDYNGSTSNYVAWNWKASNATAVTNTSGSITSSVSASTTAGFSIVSFNSTSATGTATIGHGLGAVPSMIIMKNRAYYNWEIYHISSTSTSGRLLFTTSAKLTDANPWNQSAQPVTSSIFGYDQTWNNGPSDNIIAYCFAPIAGYSAFGSYTGNGSADGTFVHTGFRPAFVMVKASSTTSSWIIFDTARDTYNVAGYEIYPNSANAETYYADLDILSNGFKHRQSGSPNASGVTYIYMAFASNPFKYSLAR